MDLWLLRHAEAEATAENDFARPLTAKGRAQSEAAAAFLASRRIAFDQILFSPVLRARQTAEIAQETLHAPLCQAEESLVCGMAPEEGCELLRALPAEAERVLLVGHEPDLGRLAAYLAGGLVEMKKAALARLSLDAPGRGSALLRALVPPKLQGRS